MTSRIALRIAALFTLFQAIAHTVGGVFGPVQPGAQAVAVAAMKSNRFDAMGTSRNYWDFFVGFGLSVTVFLLFESVLLWMFSNGTENRAVSARPFLLLVLISNIAMAILGVLYFFPATLVTPVVNVVCAAMALGTLPRPAAQPQAGRSS